MFPLVESSEMAETGKTNNSGSLSVSCLFSRHRGKNPAADTMTKRVTRAEVVHTCTLTRKAFGASLVDCFEKSSVQLTCTLLRGMRKREIVAML